MTIKDLIAELYKIRNQYGSHIKLETDVSVRYDPLANVIVIDNSNSDIMRSEYDKS